MLVFEGTGNSGAMARSDHTHPSSGAGLRAATVVMAAADSLHHGATDADFVCTGTNDEATLASALAVLPANGGRILLLDGTYNCADGLANQTIPNVTVQGQGESTVVNCATSSHGTLLPFTGASGGLTVLDIAFVSTTANYVIAAAPNTRVERCSFDGGAAGHIFVNKANLVAADCRFTNGAQAGIIGQSGNLGLKVRSCKFSGGGINMTSGGDSYAQIAQCEFGGTNATTAGIVIIGGEEHTVLGCTFTVTGNNGLFIASATGCIAQACRFTGNNTNSVVLAGGADHLLVGNRFASNTAIPVLLKDASAAAWATRCTIEANQFRPTQTTYCIQINASCLDNFVTDNDFKGAWSTATILDNGTGTITAAGNRA